jgi:hypothetical protein
MKKKVVIIYGVLFLIASVFISVTIFKQKEKEREKSIAQKLPNYQFYALNGGKSYANENAGFSTCIIYFDPDCDHCEFETKEILSHIASFPNTRFVMVTTNTKDKILGFIQRFKLNNYPQFVILQDKDYVFYKWFGHAEVPSIFVYDKNDILKRKFMGETRFEAILKSI